MNTEQQILIQRLQEAEVDLKRFLKVGYPGCPVEKDKAAFEDKWQEHLYSPEDLDSFPRWGINGGNYLVLIDSDHPRMYEELSRALPKTFEVTSPRRGLPHKYFVVPGKRDREVQNAHLHLPDILGENGKPKSIGEIRAQNNYLVAPGTTIRYYDKETDELKTGQYTITNNVPIRLIEYDEFMAAIQPFIGANTKQKISIDEIAGGIAEGERTTKLFQYACKLASIGLSKDLIVDSLKATAARCIPPFDDEEEIDRMADNALSYKPEWEEKRKQAEEAKKLIEKIGSQPEAGKKKYPPYIAFCEVDENGNVRALKPAKVAQWLAKNDHFKTDIDTGIIYYGEEETGTWDTKGPEHLQVILTKILGEENRVSHYSNILHTLKGETYTKIAFSTKVALINGLFELETLELTPFSLDEMAFHQFPVEYKPGARSEPWEEFLKQILDPEDAKTLQEWSGYLLLPDYRFHKMAWLHGTGRNGKGVWQRTMESIIGEHNVSGVGLEEFDGNHRFALAQLYGKLFNPCSEPITGNKKALKTELLKKATGQDTISAERKGTDKRLDFRNTSKITILANKFPTVKDNTTAFRERRIIIKFPHEFTGKDQKQNIEQAWLNDPEQRSGIFNWMLEGLQRLLSQGCFTEGKTQQEAEIEFQRASDTIGAYLLECGVKGKNFQITRKESYEQYKDYCEIYGLEIENDKSFTQRMETEKGVATGKIRGERAWKGITFKKLSENDLDDPQQKLPENKIETKENTPTESNNTPIQKGTDRTDGTPIYPQPISEECLNIDESKHVSQVSQVTQPDYFKVQELAIMRTDEPCDKCGKTPTDCCGFNKDGKDVFLCAEHGTPYLRTKPVRLGEQEND